MKQTEFRAHLFRSSNNSTSDLVKLHRLCVMLEHMMLTLSTEDSRHVCHNRLTSVSRWSMSGMIPVRKFNSFSDKHASFIIRSLNYAANFLQVQSEKYLWNTNSDHAYMKLNCFSPRLSVQRVLNISTLSVKDSLIFFHHLKIT